MKTINKMSRAMPTCASVAMLLLQLPTAYAQSGEGVTKTIEEVVVTANRREQNLQDVPVSVSAITGNDLQQRNITDASDIGGSMPNVRVNSPFSKSQPNFTIRGIGVANEFNPNAQSPIGIYFDEVYQGFRPSHGAALYDLERLEVLKGPQGTLYGRNTTGGAINIITNAPTLEGNEGFITAGIGNYDARTVQAAAEGTNDAGNLGVRVALLDLERDGLIENRAAELGYGPAYTNDDYNSEDTTAARLSLRYRPADDLDIVGRIYFARNTPVGHGGTPFLLGPGETDLTGTFDGSVLGERESAVNRQDDFFSASKGAQLKITYDINDSLVFSSITGYDTAEFEFSFDFDGTPTSIGQYDANNSDFFGFNQDFNLNFSNDTIDFIAGLYFGRQQVENYEDLYFFGFLDDIAGPNQFNPGVSTSVSSIINYKQYQSSAALYAEGRYDLSEKWAVTVGARLTRDVVEFNDFSSLLLDSSGNPGAYAYTTGDPMGLPILAGAPSKEFQEKTTEPTGRVLLEYHAAEDVMLYGSFSRGYRSGSFNGQSIVLPPNYVGPEFVNAWEAGFKSRLAGGRVQLNGAAFYNDYKGQQVQEVAGGAAFIRSLDGELYGAELEVIGQLSNALRVVAGLGYLHTEYDDGQFLAPGDPNASDPRGFDIGGNSFPFAPEVTASIAPEYLIADVGGGELIFSAEAQYQSHQEYDFFNDMQAQGPMKDGQDAYTLFNARVTYNIGDVSVALWGKNLTDKYYNSYAINIEGFGANYFVPGPPRTYGIDVTYRF